MSLEVHEKVSGIHGQTFLISGCAFIIICARKKNFIKKPNLQFYDYYCLSQGQNLLK